MNMFYAGIGSRETPEWALKAMKNIGKTLANKGLTLRSGGADGADLAFEKGCDLVKGKKEIMLPWKGFNDHSSKIYHYPEHARELALNFHPYLKTIKDPKRKESITKLMARNSCQILGLDLVTPSDFVVCYCVVDESGFAGGTGQALRVAQYHEIPIFNLFIPEDKKKFTDYISNIGVHNQDSNTQEDIEAP